MASPIDLGRINVGNVDRISGTIKKDGVPWNLAAGSVELKFFPPTGAVFTRAMAAVLASAGTFRYETAIGDIAIPGKWRLAVKVTDGAVVKTYPYAIVFLAVDQYS